MSEHGPPPSKRKRTLSPDAPRVTDEERPTLRRSTDLYLDDGNIVLIAEGIAFRVHKSQLKRHSLVLRDLPACLDQPAEVEFFDGCPVARLSDTCQELQAMLRALYDNIQFNAEDIPLVVAIIQISTKYRIEPIRLSAMKVLRQAYPDTLEVWDRLTEYPGDPCRVLRLENAKVLRAAALYELCTHPMESIGADDLPQEMFEAYSRGKEKIAAKLVNFFKNHILNRKEGTGCNKFCRGSWKTLETKMQSIIVESINTPNPIDDLSILSREQCVAGMCQECRTKLVEVIDKERKSIWTSLPETFELGSWDDLRGNH